MSLQTNIAAIRKNYAKQSLSEESVRKHPIEQFRVWLDEAINAEVNEPTAMVVATVGAAGKPSARVVLLKDVQEDGFVFYTNYESRKGRDLADNPFASLTFFWPSLERQVRIEGKVTKVDAAVSDAYFHSRPTGSQIGAWASPQSQPIGSREVLEEADKKFTNQFKDEPIIPRPAHWGGYLVVPSLVEFWQGRPNRLHDRIVFEQNGENWQLKRLAP